MNLRELFERRIRNRESGIEVEDQHPNEKPRGPETKPTMPAGTVRVDVSDVYDWYKLGQHISNLKGLGKHDFGKGPPSTILSFGSEDEEHKFIQTLNQIGLDITDIDPAYHDKRKGIKTDPTYNVTESNDNSVEGLMDFFRAFLKICMQELKLDKLPKIEWLSSDELSKQKHTFGILKNKSNNIQVQLTNRHPLDVMRTLAHELVHYRQLLDGRLDKNSGKTGSDIENEAHAIAGVIMRKFDDAYPEAFHLEPLAESWSKKYKKSINCSNPKGFSQKAHCAGRKARQSGKKTKSKSISENISEDQDLDEVSMSPGALSSFAKSDVAKAMTIGFEAEMAIDGMEESEPDYDNVEPDWDADETISFGRDWRRQVERFFTSGDGVNSRRDVERALEQIDEDYLEWISEQYQEWLDSEESVETITKILKKYDEDISDEDIEDTIKFKKNNYWGSIEDDVREDWEADNMSDESFEEFMEYNEMDTMRGILDRDGGLSWPYYTEPEMGGGEVSAEEVEMSFAETTGYRTKVGSGYHSAKREPGVWIFEPDSSIEPAGIELVSPPMPLDQGLEALDKFFAWAKEYGAEANKSTGFHMGVSIPDQTMDNVDHLKLILFLGDEYVLKQFGREANTFTRSSLKKIKQILSAGNVDPREVMGNFKKGLNGEAAKITRNLIVPKTDRYVSVNIKNNYIEFRSAGGNYFEKIPEIKNTLLRYVRAMSIAADPESDKNEYAKKLYKLIASAIPEEEQTINYFAKYAAGQITQSELKGAVKDVQQQRADKKNPQQAPAKPASKPASEPEAPSGRFIVNLDSNGSLWTVSYTQLSTGQRGAFDVRANSYSQVRDWFRNNHPELNLNGITQTAAQLNAGRQNESLVNELFDQYVTYLEENFADGKVKGKSRPGRVKKAGASCKGSVSELRARAKKYGGEKGKMYHWCANMKGGKK